MSFFSGYLFLKVRGNQAGTTTTQGWSKSSCARTGPASGSNEACGAENCQTINRRTLERRPRMRAMCGRILRSGMPLLQENSPDMQKLLSTYDGKIAWVFRHFPSRSSQSSKICRSSRMRYSTRRKWILLEMADLILKKCQIWNLLTFLV